MAKKYKRGDVSIGTFDILDTYTYAKGLLDGLDDDEARERGMMAAVMGAKAPMGHTGGSLQEHYKADKAAAEQKKTRTNFDESFDKQAADKMGSTSKRGVPADHEETGRGRAVPGPNCCSHAG